MHFRVLGPVTVVGADHVPVPLRSPRQRLLLALLLVADGAFVSGERLAEDLFGDDGPDDPTGALQTHVSRLRRLLPDPAALETGSHGYRLVNAGDTDRQAFERSLTEGTAARLGGDPAGALVALDAALALWRGPAFADVADHPAIEAVAHGLDDARTRAEEERVETLLDLGEAGAAATAADALVRDQPLRERPAALAMRALYAQGRHAEALAVFADLRRRLGEELGLEPSEDLRDLEGQILRHELEAAPRPPRPLAPVAAAAVDPPRVARPRTRLVGREEDLERVRAALELNRLVTLTGPGGTGKTRIALEVAWTETATAFIDLTRIGPEDDLARTVAGQLGVEQRGGQDPMARLSEVLHGRRLLLVLDNCEHVLDPAAALVDAVLGHTEHVRVLATSREALAVDGEHRLPLGPLTEDAALDLLAERAVAAGVDAPDEAHAAEAAELCRLVDRLPLGIELAAARLATTSLPELVQALHGRGDALTGGHRTAADRHRSLDALVASSYDDLNAEDQRLLRVLSLFAAPARVEDVSAVAGIDAAPGLRALTGRSLAVRVERDGRSRFGLLETVRQFGQRRLDDSEEDEDLRRAHTSWAVSIAAQAPRTRPHHGSAEDLQLVDDAMDDLRVAHRWSLDRDDRSGARAIVAPLWWYSELRVSSDVFDWARETDDRWPVSAADTDPAGIRVAAIAASGDAFQGALGDARDRALRAISAAGDDPVAAFGHAALADVELFSGNPRAAAAAYRRAFELDQQSSGDKVSAFELADEAMALAYAEDPAAQALADEALARLRERGNPSALAFGLYIAGEVRLEHDPEAAEPLLAESLELARQSENRLVAGVAAVSLLSLTTRRDPAAALAELPGLIDHWLRAGLWTQLWTTMRLVIEALAATGEEASAARLLGALATSERAGPPYGADARRLEAIRRQLEDRLGAEEVERLAAEGRAAGDEGALAEADAAAHRVTSG